MNFILIFFLSTIFIVFLTSLGFFVLKAIKLQEYNKISSLLGLSFFIFFTNIFYFFLNFSIGNISIIFFLLFFFQFILI